jgi:hypothetical protein
VIDRRELLWLCLASLAATACGVRRAPLDPDVLVLPARRHQADARLVGEAWLAAASPRPSADALAAELPQGARRVRRSPPPPAPGRPRCRRTERVEGWLLSRTEAVLYGLLASLPG